MKNTFLLILLNSVLILNGQDFLSMGIYSRVFQIKYNNNSGTCFLIEHDSSNYFVTAKHLFKGVKSNTPITFEIKEDSVWSHIEGDFWTSEISDDVAVINPNWEKFVNAIKIGHFTLISGDEGFFVGFPYGLYTEDKAKWNRGFPIPLVKKLVFSGVFYQNKTPILLFDGHNNPGFSGAPILFKDRSNQNDSKYHVIGVISAYVNQDNELVTPMGNLKYTENSGIIIGYGTNAIEYIIKDNE